ncbi:hypothetical protein JOC75_001128 [Metabacillus crassostreae]|uniref:hypothetical protein n=1 Tax=Metabacillus crassostreae TaxID=929098 RepID=UPI00195660FA|nr:hypothetical protein [Metabacillus crassostreae]MBM7603158.1 hypothetical protein [Metabacillus crassostreae]
MDQQKLNNLDNIDELTNKLKLYKQTLETIKAGKVMEDYLLMKNEGVKLVDQVSYIENEMNLIKKNTDDHLVKIQQKVNLLTEQMMNAQESMENMALRLNHLSDKIDYIKSNDFKVELVERMKKNTVPNEVALVEKNEIVLLKDELKELKKVLLEKDSEKNSFYKPIYNKQPTSFQQLKKMINSSLQENKNLVQRHQQFTSMRDPKVKAEKPIRQRGQNPHRLGPNENEKLNKNTDESYVSNPSDDGFIQQENPESKDQYHDEKNTPVYETSYNHDTDEINVELNEEKKEEDHENQKLIHSLEQSVQEKLIVLEENIDPLHDRKIKNSERTIHDTKKVLDENEKPSFFSFLQRGKNGDK